MEMDWKLFLSQIKKESPLALVCIVNTEGSTPRHAGSLMLVGRDGLLYGTVGGGLVEYHSIEAAKECLLLGENRLFTEEMSASGGMVCGGTATLFCKLLSVKDYDAYEKLASDLEECRAKGENTSVYLPEGDGAPYCITNRDRIHDTEQDEKGYEVILENPGRVFLFGDGHVAKALIPVLTTIGFVVITENHFCRPIEKQDYVVVATKGHEGDLEVLRKVLKTPAHYIGVMGSRKKAAYVREVLASEGFDEKTTDRIITPIGLPIGSETPEEIAISIAAQIISVRRGHAIS